MATSNWLEKNEMSSSHQASILIGGVPGCLFSLPAHHEGVAKDHKIANDFEAIASGSLDFPQKMLHMSC